MVNSYGYGRRMRDVLDMRSVGAEILISDRMKHVLEDNQITGWKSYPILLYDKKKNLIPGYSGFTVTGNGGRLYLPVNKGWDSSYYSNGWYRWNTNEWDGSDIFSFENNASVIITEKAYSVMRKNKIDAIELNLIGNHYIFPMDFSGAEEYLIVPDLTTRPARYDTESHNTCFDAANYHLLELYLANKNTVSIENCLEAVNHYVVLKLLDFSPSLSFFNKEYQTRRRVLAYSALDRVPKWCYRAIIKLDDLNHLLYGPLDPGSYVPTEYEGIPYRFTTADEWDLSMGKTIQTSQLLYKKAYNLLSEIYDTKILHNDLDERSSALFDDSLMRIAQAISILQYASQL